MACKVCQQNIVQPSPRKALCADCFRKQSQAKSAKHKEKLRATRAEAQRKGLPQPASLSAAIRAGAVAPSTIAVASATAAPYKPPDHKRNPSGNQQSVSECQGCGVLKAFALWGRQSNGKKTGALCKECARQRRRQAPEA